MNGNDNIAGYTLTTGLADFVITDSVAQYDPIIGNLSDGDERNYKAQFIDPSFSEQYETGRGTWNAGAGTISRTTIKTSSNNGAKENFGAGPKVVFIVSDYESLTDMNNMVDSAEGAGSLKMTTAERATIAGLGDSSSLDVGAVAGTVAAGDDGRFGAVDYGDLPAAAALDGTEVVAIDQGGDGVQTTVQDISGDPVIAVRTFAKDRITGYSNFNRIAPGYINSTDATSISLEPYYLQRGGAGSLVINGAFITGVPVLTLGTGTDTTGYACATHSEQPIAFDSTKEYDQTWSVVNVELPTGGEAFTSQVGFLVGAPALATQGMYFYIDEGSTSWFYAVKNAGGTTSATTGVTATSSITPQALRVHYDPSGTPSTKFYIAGTLVATVLNSTRVVATSTSMSMGMSIRKSAGITTRTFSAYHHSYNIQRSVLANF